MLTCKQVNEQLSEYYDKALPWRKKLAIRLHLFMCNHCRTVAKQFGLTLQVLHGLNREEKPLDHKDVVALSKKMVGWFQKTNKIDDKKETKDV